MQGHLTVPSQDGMGWDGMGWELDHGQELNLTDSAYPLPSGLSWNWHIRHPLNTLYCFRNARPNTIQLSHTPLYTFPPTLLTMTSKGSWYICVSKTQFVSQSRVFNVHLFSSWYPSGPAVVPHHLAACASQSMVLKF